MTSVYEIWYQYDWDSVMWSTTEIPKTELAVKVGDVGALEDAGEEAGYQVRACLLDWMLLLEIANWGKRYLANAATEIFL